MELFSSEFVRRVRRLLESPPVPVLFTIALRGTGFIAEAKRVPGPELMEITEATRGAAPAEILARLLGDCASGAPPPPSAGPAEGERAAPGLRGRLTRTQQ